MTVSFRAKLLATHVAVALAVGAVALLVVERSVSQRMEAQVDKRLEAQVQAVARWMERAGHPNRLAGRLAGVVGARVSIVDATGNTVGESRDDAPKLAGTEVAALGEVKAARAGAVGKETRFSSVENEQVRYVAVPASGDLVVRLGLPIGEIDETKSELRRQLAAGAIASLLVALGLAALIAGPLTQRLRDATVVAQRIGAGNYDVGKPSSTRDEVGILSRTLATAAAELKATDQRRREFLATVAHEIRTPVTSIRGFTETLSSSDVDAETRGEFIQTIHRNAIRIATLVEDLLELEALQAGKGRELDAEPVDVGAVADNVALTLHAKASMAKATVNTDIAEDVIVTADADALERILLNLVDNAIRHGGADLTVQVRAKSAGDLVAIHVVDNGVGIPADVSSRLFERFQRGGAAGGSGLGLAIARELAQSMGGSLRLEESSTDASNLGKTGTSFVLELPSRLPA